MARRAGGDALIDVSDGLAADVRHLAVASGVHVTLEGDAVPRVAGATRRDALAGGEEYELACTAPPALDVVAFAARFGLALTAIGRVRARAAGVAIGDARGRRVEFPPGHDHLTR